DYLIVDVREPNEYSKLHIRTAVNVPSGVFGTSPPEVVMQTLHLIFHCNLSLIRGPASADRTAEILSHHHKERDAARPLVSVLDGGYAEWKREYKHDAKLMV
ncbi:Rhodanese-like domain-containing protein, partial [Powellomyces hirtus]